MIEGEDQFGEMIRAARALAKGLSLASGGPWCGQCGQNFRGTHKKRVYDHVLMVHQRLYGKKLCRMFHWRWAISPYEARRYLGMRT